MHHQQPLKAAHLMKLVKTVMLFLITTLILKIQRLLFQLNFIQTEATVDSLIYFMSKLSSKFSFTNSIINFTDEQSHVLDCIADLEIQEEKDKYWHFEKNIIDR